MLLRSGQLSTGRRLDPAKAQAAIGPLDVHAVQKQHVEVNIQITRASCPRPFGAS